MNADGTLDTVTPPAQPELNMEIEITDDSDAEKEINMTYSVRWVPVTRSVRRSVRLNSAKEADGCGYN